MLPSVRHEFEAFLAEDLLIQLGNIRMSLAVAGDGKDSVVMRRLDTQFANLERRAISIYNLVQGLAEVDGDDMDDDLGGADVPDDAGEDADAVASDEACDSVRQDSTDTASPIAEAGTQGPEEALPVGEDTSAASMDVASIEADDRDANTLPQDPGEGIFDDGSAWRASEAEPEAETDATVSTDMGDVAAPEEEDLAAARLSSVDGPAPSVGFAITSPGASTPVPDAVPEPASESFAESTPDGTTDPLILNVQHAVGAEEPSSRDAEPETCAAPDSTDTQFDEAPHPPAMDTATTPTDEPAIEFISPDPYLDIVKATEAEKIVPDLTSEDPDQAQEETAIAVDALDPAAPVVAKSGVEQADQPPTAPGKTREDLAASISDLLRSATAARAEREAEGAPPVPPAADGPLGSLAAALGKMPEGNGPVALQEPS